MSRTKKKSAQGPSHRDMAQRMLIERQGAGAGKHHTRDRDVLKGIRRKGKHEMKYDENPYHKQGRDQYGKVCFYIYNDDGSPVLTGAGTPQWCYQPDKAEEMVRKAERRGLRVSPSAVSPGPRVRSPEELREQIRQADAEGMRGAEETRRRIYEADAAAAREAEERLRRIREAAAAAERPRPESTGYVRQRILEHRDKPIQHDFLVGDYVIKTFGHSYGENFYEVVTVSPSSIVIKSVGDRSVTADPYGDVRVPDPSQRGADLKNRSTPFRVMLKDGQPLFESTRYPFTRAITYRKWDGQPLNVKQARDSEP